MNLQVTYAIELVNIPISSQLCYVTMETIWKNTGGFVDGRTILRWVKEIDVDVTKWMELNRIRSH